MKRPVTELDRYGPHAVVAPARDDPKRLGAGAGTLLFTTGPAARCHAAGKAKPVVEVRPTLAIASKASKTGSSRK